MNLGSGGSPGEALGPTGTTAEATPSPLGAAPGLGLGLGFGPDAVAPLPGGGFTGTVVWTGVTDLWAPRRGGVVMGGTDFGTVVEGEVPAGTVVGVATSGVGVGGVGVAGTTPIGCVVSGADGVVVGVVRDGRVDEGALVVAGAVGGGPVV